MTNSGSPKYPCGDMKGIEPCGGITLLEHFAGLAMQSCWFELTDCNRPQHFEYAAKSCVKMADALIAELNKEQDE